jgi:glycine/D-amino acid oxidase-like deaminating enzyme
MDQRRHWGNRPWSVDFRAEKRDLPRAVDFAVVGGGFTGLAAAAWLKRVAPEKSVALFEAGRFGDGASGHTGGVALAETAVGDLPELGDVLAGYREITQELVVETDLELPGCYELSRGGALENSPIRWKDAGDLCASKEVPGGTINPGKTVSGLARAGERVGVLLFEETGVEEARFGTDVELWTGGGVVRANRVLFATNAYALDMTGLEGTAQPALTTAVMTEPLDERVIEEIGLGERKPFYTTDLPYLWGRLFGNAVIFGAGLIFVENWRGLDLLDIDEGEGPQVFESLERRIRRFHPVLKQVKFARRWGGPICFAEDWKPVFRWHEKSENAIVLGAYSGHGVAQSVYLGRWAAEVMLGKRELPKWGTAEVGK